jgi:hypothetical protein
MWLILAVVSWAALALWYDDTNCDDLCSASSLGFVGFWFGAPLALLCGLAALVASGFARTRRDREDWQETLSDRASTQKDQV